MIKKITRSFAALTALCLVATSCSSEENSILAGNENATGTEFTLSLNDKGDNQTRAARPLYASAAANNVDEVQLKLFVKSTDNSWTEATTCKFQVDETDLTDGKLEWNAGPSSSAAGTIDGTTGNVTYNPNREASQTVSIKGLSASTTYKVVAYAYDKELTTTIAFTADAATFTPNTSVDVEEIFAGEAEFTTGTDSKISSKPTVKLNRQVAGFLAYFENIPTKCLNASNVETEVAGVRVKACASAPSYTLGTPSGTTDKQNQSSTTATEVTVVNIPINNTVTSLTNFDSSKVTFKFQQKITGVYVKPNAVLAGKFLVAFAKQENKPTFKVELFDASGNTLKTWNVKNGNTTTYDVNRNEFYMIGNKYSVGVPGTDDDNKPDPDNPDPDPNNPDEPIDLHNAQEIPVTVVDAWDVIHKLELE